jgi:hypothetical protein
MDAPTTFDSTNTNLTGNQFFMYENYHMNQLFLCDEFTQRLGFNSDLVRRFVLTFIHLLSEKVKDMDDKYIAKSVLFINHIFTHIFDCMFEDMNDWTDKDTDMIHFSVYNINNIISYIDLFIKYENLIPQDTIINAYFNNISIDSITPNIVPLCDMTENHCDIDENVVDENVVDDNEVDENVDDVNVVDENDVDENVDDVNVVDENVVYENVDDVNVVDEDDIFEAEYIVD